MRIDADELDVLAAGPYLLVLRSTFCTVLREGLFAYGLLRLPRLELWWPAAVSMLGRTAEVADFSKVRGRDGGCMTVDDEEIRDEMLAAEAAAAFTCSGDCGSKKYVPKFSCCRADGEGDSMIVGCNGGRLDRGSTSNSSDEEPDRVRRGAGIANVLAVGTIESDW